PTMMGFMMAGFIGGFICALICTFSPKASKYVSPLYAILEGFALAGISAFLNDMFKVKYPNIIMEGVLLTFGVALAVFILYNALIIRATNKFRAVMLSSVVGIAAFYGNTGIRVFYGTQLPY